MKYYQKTGVLTTNEDKLIGEGYAGHGLGKNNPEMQAVKDTGPLPVGRYMVGEPYDNPNTGPFTLPLIPDPKNKMFGRSGFKMHGDSISAPGTASHGCIIMPRTVRVAVHNSTDKYIDVYK